MFKASRVVIVLCYFFFIAFIGSFLCLFRPFNPDNTRLCGRMFSWGGLKLLGMKITVEGAEHLTKLPPSVVVANHQDNIDLFVHGRIVPYRTVSIGKKILRYIPLFGQVYWLAGNILIDRSKTKQSVNAMTQTTVALKENRTSLWVFAEGTRDRGEGLLPFKKGAFHMAIDAGVPIVPICASNYAKHTDLAKFHSGEVIIKVLPPISTQGMDKSNVDELLALTHAKMKQTIEQLDLRVLS